MTESAYGNLTATSLGSEGEDLDWLWRRYFSMEESSYANTCPDFPMARNKSWLRLFCSPDLVIISIPIHGSASWSPSLIVLDSVWSFNKTTCKTQTKILVSFLIFKFKGNCNNNTNAMMALIDYLHQVCGRNVRSTYCVESTCPTISMNPFHQQYRNPLQLIAKIKFTKGAHLMSAIRC